MIVLPDGALAVTEAELAESEQVISILEAQLRASVRMTAKPLVSTSETIFGYPVVTDESLKPDTVEIRFGYHKDIVTVKPVGDLTVRDFTIETLEDAKRTIAVLLSHLQACRVTLNDTHDYIAQAVATLRPLPARILIDITDRVDDVDDALEAMRDGAH